MYNVYRTGQLPEWYCCCAKERGSEVKDRRMEIRGGGQAGITVHIVEEEERTEILVENRRTVRTGIQNYVSVGERRVGQSSRTGNTSVEGRQVGIID